MRFIFGFQQNMCSVDVEAHSLFPEVGFSPEIRMFNSFRKFQQNWSTMSPLRKHNFLKSLMKSALHVFGCRILSDARVYWLSYMGMWLIFYYIFFAAYTIHYHIKRDELVVGLKCLCCFGIVTSTIPIYWKSVGPSRFKFTSLLLFSSKYLYADRNNFTEFTALCHGNVRKLIKSSIVSTSLLLVSLTAMVTGNIYVYLTDGILSTPLGFEVPYFEGDSIVGFYINMIIQSGYAIAAIMAAIVVEMCQSLFNNTICLFVALILMRAREISSHLKTFKKANIQFKIAFRNILIQIQDFER